MRTVRWEKGTGTGSPAGSSPAEAGPDDYRGQRRRQTVRYGGGKMAGGLDAEGEHAEVEGGVGDRAGSF